MYQQHNWTDSMRFFPGSTSLHTEEQRPNLGYVQCVVTTKRCKQEEEKMSIMII